MTVMEPLRDAGFSQAPSRSDSLLRRFVTMTNETMDARLDRLEAMLVGLVDQVERLKDQVVVPLCLQEATLRRVEQAVDELRTTKVRLPPPPRLETPAEDSQYS